MCTEGGAHALPLDWRSKIQCVFSLASPRKGTAHSYPMADVDAGEGIREEVARGTPQPLAARQERETYATGEGKISDRRGKTRRQEWEK